MFNLPTAKTVVGKLAIRCALVAVVAVLGFLLSQPELAQGSVAYLVVKTAYDFLNNNVPNL